MYAMPLWLCGAVALALLGGSSAFEANSQIALDLQPGACTAFEIDSLPHKYSYDVELIALTGICLPSNIRYALRECTQGVRGSAQHLLM
jgi:hypothetical protein